MVNTQYWLELIKRYFRHGKFVLDLEPLDVDKRDLKLRGRPKSGTVDLSWDDQEVKYQGRVGSCASHTAMSLFEQQINKINVNFLRDPVFKKGFSERYHYYFARKLNGGFPKFGGMTVRDMFKVMHKYGMAPDKLCPYKIAELNDEPNFAAQQYGRNFWKIKDYFFIKDSDEVVTCLNSGRAVGIGLKVWNFKADKTTGYIPMPDLKRETYRGGHAVTLLGYDAMLDRFKGINSWGTWWGKKGYFYIDREYVDTHNVGIGSCNIDPKWIKTGGASNV